MKHYEITVEYFNSDGDTQPTDFDQYVVDAESPSEAEKIGQEEYCDENCIVTKVRELSQKQYDQYQKDRAEECYWNYELKSV